MLLRAAMLLRFVLSALAVVAATPVAAQLAANLEVDTDNRFRGVSLSGGKPSLRAGVSYDDASGFYTGMSATDVELDSRRRRAALLGYAGYARTALNGLAWELGLTATHFDGDSLYDYGEVFFGLNAQRWNLRAYLSPSYFGSGVRTLYLEANGGMALIGPLRAFAHMGALRPIGQVDAADSRRTRADARAGLAIGAAAAEVRLAWVHGSRAGLYPIAYGDHRNAWVASASWFF